MYRCSEEHCIRLLCCAQVRNLIPSLTATTWKPSYLRWSVSDLAQVLNVTSSQLCIASSSVDASKESASFAEGLDESLTSWIQPYRYTCYETSSSLRPTIMLFGCPLPDELDGASVGQRAVDNAFKTILSSADKMYPFGLYKVICDAHKLQGVDTKLVRYLSMWPAAVFAHVTVHSQHSNWNLYGTHLSWMVVPQLFITWPQDQVIIFLEWVYMLVWYGEPLTMW